MRPEHRKYFNDLAEDRLLALCIWAEARGEGMEGRIAVGSVVLNRVDYGRKHDPWGRRYGNSVHTVILAPYQFSWTMSNDPQYKKALAIAKDFKAGLRKYPTLNTCMDIAEKLISGEMKRNVKGTIYFNPQTATNKKFIQDVHAKCMFEQTIGRHEFWIE